MISNSNEHYFLLEARRSKKFKELDDKARVLAVELGKGKGNKAEYNKLAAERDKQLNEFIAEQTKKQPVTKIEFGDKTDKKNAALLCSYCDKYPNTKLKNIVLSGATGTGKTHCAEIVERKLKAKGVVVYFSSAYNIVKRMRDYSFGADPAAYNDIIDSSVLIIDDLGTEPNIQNSDDFLYTVINERYSAGLPFIITTNLSNEQIFNRYDQRVAGRIFDKNKTAVIVFTGKDLRVE